MEKEKNEETVKRNMEKQKGKKGKGKKRDTGYEKQCKGDKGNSSKGRINKNTRKTWKSERN